jgi:hypothetical protein
MKLRFSLKSLLVFVTLVGVWLGWRTYVARESVVVLRTYHQLMSLLEAGDFDQAYPLTTDKYRAEHSLEEFSREFSHHSIPGNQPHDPNASVNSLFLFEAEIYEHAAPGFLDLLSGKCFVFRRERGEWRFTGKVNQYLD